MKRAYVAGPYRSDTENGIYENIQSARAVALDLWKRGYAVLCPHMNTAFMGGHDDDSMWLEGDIEWMQYADVVVLAPGWRKSAGTLEEIRVAIAETIPVYVWDGCGNDLVEYEDVLLESSSLI